MAAAALLLWIEPAAAQDCGDWFRPMVCSAELLVTDSDYNTSRLGERTRVQLGPRQQLDLELEARDQRGRRFPAERVALSYDAYDCRSILQVEDRGEGQLRVTATAAEGRCTLEIFMPNNLNFEWEIDIEISVGARVGYERAEAEILARALYMATLGREPDDSGFRSAVSEIQSGNLEGQVQGMLGSAEFREVTAGMRETDILEQFYQGILGRSVDSNGLQLYRGEMRSRRYAGVLLQLIRSPEFERRLQR